MDGPGPWFDSACSGMEKQRGEFLSLRRSKVHRPMLFHDAPHLNDSSSDHLANGYAKRSPRLGAKLIKITLT